MSPESNNAQKSISQELRPIGVWLGLVMVAFTGLAISLGFLADALPVPSPGSELSAQNDLATIGSGHPSTDFRLPSLSGEVLGPPDFLGKVVVMDLWATWCGPCRLQAQYLDQLHSEYGDAVQFLAIDVGEDEATVRRYVERSPFPYPVLLDPTESIQQRFRATGLPTVMVVDPAGRVSYLNVGVADPATLRREIAKAEQSTPTQGSV